LSPTALLLSVTLQAATSVHHSIDNIQMSLQAVHLLSITLSVAVWGHHNTSSLQVETSVHHSTNSLYMLVKSTAHLPSINPLVDPTAPSVGL